MKYLQKIVYNNNVLPLLIFLIPSIGIITGFAVAPLVFVLFFIIILNMPKKLLFNKDWLKNFKLELLFLSWMLLSLIWTIKFSSSISTFMKIGILFLIGVFIMNYTEKLYPHLKKARVYLVLGCLTALILFLIEWGFYGVMHKTFFSTFNINKEYYLWNLDKGCALLSTTSWVVIGILIDIRKQTFALLFYCILLIILVISDSLASTVAFMISGIIFALSRYNIKILRLISVMIIVGSLLMPVISYFINPKQISDKLTILPLTAKIRIFIWHFVAEKSTDKILIGHGFASSKNYPLKKDDIVTYDNESTAAIPLHPHNNVMQILLELGLVGLGLFLAIVYKTLRKFEQISKKNINFGTIAYACFVNYYIIGAISYSMWQTWWVYAGVWVAIMLKWMLEKSDGDFKY